MRKELANSLLAERGKGEQMTDYASGLQPQSTMDQLLAAEQDKWLADAKAAVKQQAFYMKRAIDEDNLRDVFKYSSAMLGELRTSLLSPQKYYELYMRAFDELRQLEMFFEEQRGKGHTASELYELVQHAGNVLPRLYLLVTVGAVFIRSHESPIKSLLKDLVEMCGGIQHPVRGLFLRTYLTQTSREGLNLIEAKVDEESTTADAVEFVLQNFTEMNKLWVRMKHQGPVRERAKREKERKELRDLVGKNLVILSSMEEVDVAMYGEIVLPRILEQLVNCKDELAQSYLMDCIIQVFPDDFHVRTLETFVEGCGNLHPDTDVAQVLCGLIRRLINFLENDADVASALFEEHRTFEKLLEPTNKISGKVGGESAASIYSAILDFAVKTSASSALGRVDEVLSQCASALQTCEITSAASRTLKTILMSPLDTYAITDLLDLSSYPDVMHLLSPAMQKAVAVDIVEKILAKGTVIPDVKKVASLFDFISTIVEGAEEDEEDEEEIEEEQNLVARLVHRMQSDRIEETFAILKLAKDRFQKGGPLRVKHTLPTIVFNVLQLVKRSEDEEKSTDMLKFLHQVIDIIAEVPEPEKAFKLYLECVLVADLKKLETNAYDFATAAFDIYENGIPDQKAQVEALKMLIGCLDACSSFGEENFDALSSAATKWSIKLLKKSDQCVAVYSCAHLFTSTGGSPEKVLVCLKRALQSAKQAQGMAKSSRGEMGPVELLVGILNKYLYFFDKQDAGGEGQIKLEDVQNLLDLVSNEVSSLTTSGEASSDKTIKFYHNTLRHIMHLKEKFAEKYQNLSMKT